MDEDNFIDYEKRSHLDENQLEYRLFILNKPESNNNNNIDDLFDELNNYINKLSLNYIWNNEKFILNKPKLIDNTVYVSEGIIDYSDNVDDEWFIVYLIIELTLKYENKIIVQLIDSDGDFILIYLANYLPKWASSSANDCMKNRVFIFNGELHIIPPATNPAQITYLPAHGAIKSSFEAINIVRDFKTLTRASQSLQDNLKKRVDLFKNYDKVYLHQTTCRIPAKLAWVLSSNCNFDNKNLLLSKAINRFCDKDPSDLKLCRTLKTFKAVDLIDYRVTFTKFLYCKLKYCEFNADKRHEWPNFVAENAISSATLKDRLQLGLKLTCAFELLAKLDEINEDELNDDKNFHQYIENLHNLGYFRDYLKGSQEYQKLYEQAKVNYSSNEQHVQHDANKTAFRINNVLKDMPKNYLEQLNEEINLIQKQHNDDNDDWLHIDQTQLDDYLEMYSNGNVSSTYDFKIISDAFKKFLDLKDQPDSSSSQNKTKINKAKSANLYEGLDYKAIGKEDEELIDFNVNLIENNLNELLSLNRKEDELDDDASVESDSFYEINKNEFSDEEDDDIENKNLKEYIKAMDHELENEKNLAHLKTYTDESDEDENGDKMLNLDVNLVTNAIESYSSQLGLTGPVSNILKSLGI